MRFDPSGEADDGFSGDGAAEVAGLGCGFGEAHVAVQPDGKLVVGAGTTDVARFGVDGTPDATFGSGGEVVTPGGDAVAGLVVQPDGRIVMASGCKVIRFTADGSVDPVFATQALGTSGKRGGGQAEDVALGAGGAVLVAGLSAPPQTDIKVMRFDGGSGSAVVSPLPTRLRLSRALASGLEVAATCPAACVISSELRMDARTARRLGAVAARTVRVGGGRKRLLRAGATTVRVRFTSSARRALRRQRRVRVTLVTTLRPRTGRVTTKRQVLTLRGSR